MDVESTTKRHFGEIKNKEGTPMDVDVPIGNNP